LHIFDSFASAHDLLHTGDEDKRYSDKSDKKHGFENQIQKGLYIKIFGDSFSSCSLSASKNSNQDNDGRCHNQYPQKQYPDQIGYHEPDET